MMVKEETYAPDRSNTPMLIHRTTEEMKAFAEGYTLCFKQLKYKMEIEGEDVTDIIKTLAAATETVNIMARDQIIIGNGEEKKYCWISCKKRLPEEKALVAVVESDGECRGLNKIIDGKWSYSGNPIAWFPLPEPYKEMEE